MSQRKAKPPAEKVVFRYQDALAWTPKKDWVEMSDGRWICVWQLSVADTMRLSEVSQRHPSDPRPGPNEMEAALWQIALACHAGEEPDAERVWPDTAVRFVMNLDPEDFNKIMRACGDLMGIGKEAGASREAFTAAAVDGSTLASSIGA